MYVEIFSASSVFLQSAAQTEDSYMTTLSPLPATLHGFRSQSRLQSVIWTNSICSAQTLLLIGTLCYLYYYHVYKAFCGKGVWFQVTYSSWSPLGI